MKIVAKSTSPLIPLGDFPTASELLLRRHWRGELNELEKAHATELMVSLHRRKVWLECDCVRDASGEGPILLFYHRQDGFYGIRRMTGRINHTKDCDFHWEQRESANQDGVPNFLLYQPSFLVTPQDTKVIPFRRPQSGKNSRGTSSFGTLFYWLINEAGLNQLDGSTVQADERTKRLFRVARAVQLPNMKLVLGDIIWTLPDAYIKRWAHSTLLKMKDRGIWNIDLPLQGYLILPIKSISGNVLVSSGDRRIEVSGLIENDGEQGCFPRMALISISEVGNRIFAQQAYTVPVRYYGHTRKDDGEMRHYFDLFPVLTSREREVANELATITRWKHDKGPEGTGVTVRRPVLATDLAYGCNFVIEAGGARVYVLLPDNDSDVASIRMEHVRRAWMDRKHEQDRVFTLNNNEPAEKLKGQVLGWLKGEMKYE